MPSNAAAQVVRLASEIDFAGWRAAARRLRAAAVEPAAVIWTVDGEGAAERAGAEAAAFTVPRAFLGLAADAILHRSGERFALLYALLWRMRWEPGLLAARDDPEAARARGFAQAVRRAAYRMKAFTDFRTVGAAGEPPLQVAWFEPAHRVTERVAPFFTRRQAGGRFSLLTPDACAHWDGAELAFTPGVDPADAPAGDSLEEFWRHRFAGRFGGNPEPGAAVRVGPVPP